MLTQHSQSLGMMFCAGIGGVGKGEEEEGGNGRTGKRIDGENLLGSRQIKVQLQEIHSFQNSGLVLDSHYQCVLRIDI